MFGIGFLVILAAVLLMFGPERLNEIAKVMGKCTREFKKGLEGEDEQVSLPAAPRAEQRAVSRGQDFT